MMAVDLDGRILFANRGAEILFGWSREQTIGRLAAEVSGVTIDPAVASEIFAAVSKGGTWEGMFEVRRADGAVVSCTLSISPLYDARGHVAGVVSLAMDATRERTDRFLADCAAVLGSSLDFAHNLNALALLTVPFLGDICFIDMAEGDSIRRVAAVHVDPRQAVVDRRIGQRYPPIRTARIRGQRAALRCPRFFLAEVTDDVVSALARDDEHYRAVQELNFRSFMCVPLKAGRQILGAVTVVSCTSDRRFGPEDVELLAEVARRAATALENARRFDDQQQARAQAESSAERLFQLQTLATALSSRRHRRRGRQGDGSDLDAPSARSIAASGWSTTPPKPSDLVEGFDFAALPTSSARFHSIRICLRRRSCVTGSR